MSDYDCIMMWDTKAAALADAVAILSNTSLDAQGARDWLRDHVIPDLQVWRNSLDTTTTDAQGNTIVVHSYIAKYFALISLTHRVAAIESDPALVLALDRDKMNARQAGFVLFSAYSNAILQDIRFQPVFLGMDVPWGGLQ